MLNGPLREITLSSNEKDATPSESVSMLPKSPTCLEKSVGAPCALSRGLKWGPADVQPLLRSPEALDKECKDGHIF